MGFDSGYLEQRALFPELIKEEPDKNTGIIVVVPAYDEPGITSLLDSLALCSPVPCSIEILIVVNAPDGASSESLRNNKQTLENILTWKKHKPECFFRVYPVMAIPLPVKGWA